MGNSPWIHIDFTAGAPLERLLWLDHQPFVKYRHLVLFVFFLFYFLSRFQSLYYISFLTLSLCVFPYRL